MSAPDYHDLHITTKAIPRTRLSDLPLGYEVACNRVSGWQLWDMNRITSLLLADEFGDRGLRLDVGGHVICDSLKEEQ